MFDEKSPPLGREPETPPEMEWSLTTKPQPHASGSGVIYHGDR